MGSFLCLCRRLLSSEGVILRVGVPSLASEVPANSAPRMRIETVGTADGRGPAPITSALSYDYYYHYYYVYHPHYHH